MPNWCENELTITSESADELQKVLNSIKSEDEYLDFNKVVAYPDEYAKADKAASDWRKNNPHSSWSNCPKNGFNNGGYEWCVENWGTKWNVSDVDLDLMDDEHVVIKFSTAWCPPEKILNTLREKFTECEFSMFYREDGMQLSGYL